MQFCMWGNRPHWMQIEPIPIYCHETKHILVCGHKYMKLHNCTIWMPWMQINALLTFKGNYWRITITIIGESLLHLLVCNKCINWHAINAHPTPGEANKVRESRLWGMGGIGVGKSTVMRAVDECQTSLNNEPLVEWFDRNWLKGRPNPSLLPFS